MKGTNPRSSRNSSTWLMAKKLLQRRELREKKPARMSAAMGGLDPPPTGPGRWEVGGGRWELGLSKARDRGDRREVARVCVC